MTLYLHLKPSELVSLAEDLDSVYIYIFKYSAKRMDSHIIKFRASRSVVLTLQQYLNHMEGLLYHMLLGCTFRLASLVGLEWNF